MALDQRRLPDDRHRLDHVRIERALREKIDLAELGRFRLEHVDEGRADDLALLLRIDDARQPVEKQRRRIDEDQRQLAAARSACGSAPPRSRRSTPLSTKMHVSLSPIGAVKDERGHRRIDAAAERADDAPAADLRADFRRRLFDKRRHRPVAGAAAHPIGEVAQDLETAFGVRHLGMKQEGEQPPLRVRHRGNRRIGARRDHGEPCRRRGHEIAVAGPDADLRRDTGKHRPRVRQAFAGCKRTRPAADGDGCGNCHRGMPELALRRGRDASAERMRHQLHPVTDAEHGTAHLEQRGVASGGTCVGHAFRPPGQDDAGWLA